MTAPGVEDISFDLRRGEILGFAGLVGAGRTELMNAIYGASEKSKGTITINGKIVNMKSPHDGIRFGLGMIPEDRKLQGIFLRASVLDNISSANLKRLMRFGLIKDKAAVCIASEFRDKLRIRPLRFPSWPKISAEEISKRWRLQRHWRPIRKS